MGYVVLEAPAAEPVSAAAVARHLRLTSDAEAAAAAALAPAARALVEARIGAALIRRRVRETRRVIEIGPDGALAAAFAPVVSILAARWLGPGGSSGPLETRLDPSDPRDVVRVRTPSAAEAVEIDLIVGYAAAPTDLPADLRQAVLDATAALHFGRSDPNAPAIGARAAAALAPYLRGRAP